MTDEGRRATVPVVDQDKERRHHDSMFASVPLAGMGGGRGIGAASMARRCLQPQNEVTNFPSECCLPNCQASPGGTQPPFARAVVARYEILAHASKDSPLTAPRAKSQAAAPPADRR
jgi:hypothetical protein